jgi:hypothetical protein
MAFQRLVEKICLNPKRLFLIDAFGAVISASLLGVILVKLEDIFGIPLPAFCLLALLPIGFALYDFYCFINIKENIGLFLKGIAYANLLYCCISLGLAFYHYVKITYLGWTYIVLEIFMVTALAMLELRIAKLTLKKK